MARTAAELMTAPVVTITEEASIEQAAGLMRRRGVGRLPVMSRLTGRLAGIVTRSDLLRVYPLTVALIVPEQAGTDAELA